MAKTKEFLSTKQYKGFVIAETTVNTYHNPSNYKFQLYTKDEWSYGYGYRTPEWECDNLKEAKEFIDCY